MCIHTSGAHCYTYSVLHSFYNGCIVYKFYHVYHGLYVKCSFFFFKKIAVIVVIVVVVLSVSSCTSIATATIYT